MRATPRVTFMDLPPEERAAIVTQRINAAIAAGTHSEGPPMRMCDGCREWAVLVHVTLGKKHLCETCWGKKLCVKCRRWVDRVNGGQLCPSCGGDR